MEYKALIDGDLLSCEMGQDIIAGNHVTLHDAKKNIDNKLYAILNAAGCGSWELYLTDGPSNFRHKIATIKEYKGNRNELSKPVYWSKIRSYMVRQHNAEIVYGFEADDAMAMGQRDDTVICTRDRKDLDQVEGWHYSWQCGKQKEKKLYKISEIDGLKNFYTQLLTGDSGDNIPGIFGLGIKTAQKKLEGKDTESSLFTAVREVYRSRFGNYWELFLTENARLLYLLRHKEDKWTLPLSPTPT